MPDDDLNDVEDDDNITRLREAHDRQEAARKEAEALAATAARENAFLKAGIDTDHPLARTLLATYQGELTKDAVTQFVNEQGAAPVLLAPPDTTGDDGSALEPGEDAATRERTALAEGAAAPGTTDGAHPGDAAWDAFEGELKRGVKREDAAGAGFAEIFDAAVRGDDRVLIKRSGYNA